MPSGEKSPTTPKQRKQPHPKNPQNKKTPNPPNQETQTNNFSSVSEPISSVLVTCLRDWVFPAQDVPLSTFHYIPGYPGTCQQEQQHVPGTAATYLWECAKPLGLCWSLLTSVHMHLWNLQCSSLCSHCSCRKCWARISHIQVAAHGICIQDRVPGHFLALW